MDLTGIIKLKTDIVVVSDKFKKREFVVTDNSSQYPQHIQFQLSQDKCGLLDRFKVGDAVKVYFNLRGREWTDKEGKVKYFNSLEAWKIDSATISQDEPEQNEFSISSHTDDLPF